MPAYESDICIIGAGISAAMRAPRHHAYRKSDADVKVNRHGRGEHRRAGVIARRVVSFPPRAQ